MMRALTVWILALSAFFLLGALCIDLHITRASRSAISSQLFKDFSQDLAGAKSIDVLVLGAKVKEDKSPSAMLQERLDQAALLYDELRLTTGSSFKIVLSGAAEETNVMMRYLIEHHHLDPQFLREDPKGLNTSASFDNLAAQDESSKQGSLIVVSQAYHLPRSLYLARQAGFKQVYGAACDTQRYPGQAYRDAREVLARCKDFFLSQMGK